MFPLSCARARARTTFRPARTAFTYWTMLSIGHEYYCSQGTPMRAQRNKIRGNIACRQKVFSARFVEWLGHGSRLGTALSGHITEHARKEGLAS